MKLPKFINKGVSSINDHPYNNIVDINVWDELGIIDDDNLLITTFYDTCGMYVRNLKGGWDFLPLLKNEVDAIECNTLNSREFYECSNDNEYSAPGFYVHDPNKSQTRELKLHLSDSCVPDYGNNIKITIPIPRCDSEPDIYKVLEYSGTVLSHDEYYYQHHPNFIGSDDDSYDKLYHYTPTLSQCSVMCRFNAH